MMDAKTLIQLLHDHPEQIGIAVGFKDLRPIHGEWMRNMIFGKEDYTLMAHRGSYKSSCLSVAIALMLVLYPTDNIIFLRKADNDVSEMLRMVGQALESQILKDIVAVLYGCDLVITERSQSHLSTNLWTSPSGAPQMRGLGIKSSITGSHASGAVITDDICGPSDRSSKAEREITKRAYFELHNIANRGTKIINLGTRWHREDVFAYMPNQHIYTCYDTGLMTKDEIKKKREEMPPALFAANYELKIISDEEALFDAPQMLDDTADNTALIYNGMAHVDAAYSGADYTAYTIMRELADGRIIAYGRMWRKHVDDCIADIAAIHQQYRAGSLLMETNGDKGYGSRDFSRAGFHVNTYHEKTNKYIKIATYLRKNWNRIYWLADTDPEYLDQILGYSETAAEHDDAPDSAASLVRAITDRPQINTSKWMAGGIFR